MEFKRGKTTRVAGISSGAALEILADVADQRGTVFGKLLAQELRRWTWERRRDEIEREVSWHGRGPDGDSGVVWQHDGDEHFLTEDGSQPRRFSSLKGARLHIVRRSMT